MELPDPLSSHVSTGSLPRSDQVARLVAEARKYGRWTPHEDRSRLFPEDIDTDDPWQFKNFRVV